MIMRTREGVFDKHWQEVSKMGEMKGLAQYEIDLLKEKLHAKALHRRNVYFMKKEVERETRELKKLLNTR